MIKVLALDLEGTLINSIYNPMPRPHLYKFLEFCFKNIPQTVLFTAASYNEGVNKLNRLEAVGAAPMGTADMPVVKWERHNNTTTFLPKNLQFVQKMFPEVKLHEIFLVDDIEGFVALGQQDQYIPILSFQGSQATVHDTELLRIKDILVDILAGDWSVTRRGYRGFDVPIIGDKMEDKQ